MKNPQKAIPVSIISSLLACCGAYCSVSIIITLMVPYYDMDHDAPLPIAFKQVGYTVAQWIISVGKSMADGSLCWFNFHYFFWLNQNLLLLIS